MSATIVWLRRDLRLADNPALHVAVRHGDPVLPVVLWPAPRGEARPIVASEPGGAGRWWLARSLAALDHDLTGRGSRLIVRRTGVRAGGAAASIAALADETGARRVVWAGGIDTAQRAEDERVRDALAGAGVEPVVVSSASLLVAPDAVATSKGGPYQVFTPFWRAVSSGLRPPVPLPAPDSLAAPAAFPAVFPSPRSKGKP